MIDRDIKRSLGQMMKGIEVVGARHDGVSRAYTSHWVTQISFEEPIVLASVSPKHDTFPLIVASGEFSVSILAGDQIAEGQYFSYPGRKFRHMASEYLTDWPDDASGPPIVPNSIAYLRCSIFEQSTMADHELLFARVVAVQEGRLKEPPLLYSSRLGWRITGQKAREPGVSIRDQLLERLGALDDGGDNDADADGDGSANDS
jgi:3-hydroxy-9,10-secoandrosta-1,3,5(10)-triene-9,17-dione monooxygenase reductase component